MEFLRSVSGGVLLAALGLFFLTKNLAGNLFFGIFLCEKADVEACLKFEESLVWSMSPIFKVVRKLTAKYFLTLVFVQNSLFLCVFEDWIVFLLLFFQV